MKIPIPALVAGAFLLIASQLFAQESGVSHPEALNDTITVAPPQPVVPQVAPALRTRAAEPVLTIAPVATTETAEVVPPARLVVVPVPAVDPADAGIVTTYPFLKNALAEGTLIKVRLNEKLSSKTTVAGTQFTAQLASDVMHDGKVVLPAGAVLNGRVTSVHGGRRIGGAASLHLEPASVTLPDGSQYKLNARVIDLDQYHSSKVNAEGTILRSDHAKGTLMALGLTTGSAAVAGAVIGGAPGAAVGAGVGAGIGAVWWLKRDRAEVLAEGTQLVFSLDRPMELTPAAAN